MIIEKKPEHLLIKFLGIKIKIRTNKKNKKLLKSLNKFFEDESNCVRLPKIKNRHQTLEILNNSNKSMCRYGDGEFNLIFGHDLAFQDYSEELAARLKEILKSNDENILVGIPDKFGSLEAVTDACAEFWRAYFVYNREKVYSLLDMEKDRKSVV